MPLILQAEAFSSNSSGSINDDQIPKSYPESNNNDSILTTSFDRTTTTAAASSAYFHGDSSGDISSTVEMSHAESAFSMPCPPPMSLMNCCYFQEPYVIPYMSPNWQCNGYYWVVSPFYIPPFGSIDVTPNYSL